ncbi:hypothetical protein D3C75_986930 [compost metagenome]
MISDITNGFYSNALGLYSPHPRNSLKGGVTAIDNPMQQLVIALDLPDALVIIEKAGLLNVRIKLGRAAELKGQSR